MFKIKSFSYANALALLRLNWPPTYVAATNSSSIPPSKSNKSSATFATLVNVTQSTPDSRAQYSGDELQFEFTYKLSQVKAIQEKTYSVAITIKTKNKSRPVILTSRKLGMLNTNNLIDNILTHRTKINNINLNENL